MCRSGGTGRRTGLKILRDLPLVPVRFRSSAPLQYRGVEQLAARWAHNPKVVGSSPTSATIIDGPLVKRSRHRPFTAVTGVRFPYGSPNQLNTRVQLNGRVLAFQASCEGSIPFTRSRLNLWDYSSAGRAPALQAGGHRFEPCQSHHLNTRPGSSVGQNASLSRWRSRVRAPSRSPN